MTCVIVVSQEAVTRYLENTPGASIAEVEKWRAKGEVVIKEDEKNEREQL